MHIISTIGIKISCSTAISILYILNLFKGTSLTYSIGNIIIYKYPEFHTKYHEHIYTIRKSFKVLYSAETHENGFSRFLILDISDILLTKEFDLQDN